MVVLHLKNRWQMVTFHESTAWFGMAVLHLAWHPVPGLGVTGVT
jgi:hypothetical protein